MPDHSELLAPVSLETSRGAPPERPRFLSEADCHAIATRLWRFARGGGETGVSIVSRWYGNVRWARNEIVSTSEDRDNRLRITRMRHGSANPGAVMINETSDEALVAAVRRSERLGEIAPELGDAELAVLPNSPFRYPPEPAVMPQLFSEATYQLSAAQRAGAARQLMEAAQQAGMISAGYIEVSAVSYAFLTSYGYARYEQYTWSQYSNTVRDAKGLGSGWAGVDWPDWTKIDGGQLSALALEKCLKSRNPVAIEPGRYTTILEPQALGDLLAVWGFKASRVGNETEEYPWHKSGDKARLEPPFTHRNQLAELGLSRIGERVIDERLTLRADPLDPELGFPVLKKLQDDQDDEELYHPALWIERGVLRALPYSRNYAIELLGKPTGLWSEGAMRVDVTGPTASIEEMIATTKRGVLVTRLDQVMNLDVESLLYRGYTRDGVWLIENGAIAKPVKNMMFVESLLFLLNNVEQVGVPRRCFHPAPGGDLGWRSMPAPIVAPALKVRDFSFTALSSAI